MERNNRQILVNPHSSQEKVPVGALNLGEIAVQHNTVDDAALYIETVADSQSAETIAKFIAEKAIDRKIDDAMDVIQTEIDSINDAVGLPHDPETWESGMTVWDAIEHTYQEMTAGTAAANTRLELSGGTDEYLELGSTRNVETSSITYYLKSKGIDERVNSAYTILNEKVTELSAATENALENLDTTGITPAGQAIVNVTETDGIVTPVPGDIAAEHVTIADEGDHFTAEDVEAALQELAEKVDTNDVELVALTAEEIAELQDAANVREAYKLVHKADTARTPVTDVIKVWKDSSLIRSYLGHVDDALESSASTTVVTGTGDTALCFIYQLADGSYELVAIDVNDFLEESEFGDGLEVDNHIVSVKVDNESEEVTVYDEATSAETTAPVLSVGPDGVKISNIQAAIDYAVSKNAGLIDADITGSDDHVSVEVVQSGTELTQVIVTTDDIASEEELKTVEESIGLGPNGEFVPAESGFTSAATTVMESIQAIDEVLKEVSEKLNAAEVFETTGSVENFVTLTIEEIEAGKTGITIDDSDLKTEIDTIVGSTASTSAETSLAGLKKLIEEVSNNLNDNTVQDAEFAVLTDNERDAAHCNAGITVVDNEGGDGKKVQLDLSLLKVDCGEY